MNNEETASSPERNVEPCTVLASKNDAWAGDARRILHPRSAARAIICILCLWGAGCCFAPMDGLVELEGRVVRAPETASQFVSAETMPPETLDTIAGATVELWTSDGSRRLCSMITLNGGAGYFDVGYTGEYQPKMEYILRASAPGYQSLEARIRLRRHCYGVIYLAPSTTGSPGQHAPT